jgi:gluconokinase
LKEAYRRRLRSAVDSMKVVYLQIDAEDARSRVASRSGHLFPASLVDSQFAILEPPEPGPDVLVLSAIQSPSTLCAQALRWMGCGIE